MSVYLDATSTGMGRRRRRTRRVRGHGFLSSLWNGVKSVAPSVLRATGVLSKAANFIPYVGAPLSGAIKSAGYGRRRRRVVRRRVVRRAPMGGRRRRVRRGRGTQLL